MRCHLVTVPDMTLSLLKIHTEGFWLYGQAIQPGDGMKMTI